jgi:hypothetical protein
MKFLDGITLDEYNADKDNNDLIFQMSASKAAGIAYSDSVEIKKITPVSAVAALSKGSVRSRVPKLQASQLQMDYTVSFYLGEGNSFTTPDQSAAALSTSVSSGDFTNLLQSNANQVAKSSKLTTVTAPSTGFSTSAPVVTPVGSPTVAPESSNDDGELSSGEIAAAVVVPILVVIFAFGVRPYFLY